ncbi:GNAT family N-acetyltransferase [Amycolatopsis kentuckyensis]|uniref:GNAT family N-acetyltransferase n=1 Tax=Amycolatopsis kentuckyensis TaxID=218823 RepID=UPI001FC97A7D|nr:GNAT family N-acetyltransferase [Amycolatopsis kentuckyensis]
MTLAQRPDLAEAVYAIPYPPESPRFMEGSLTSLLVRGRRMARRWPHLVVALLEDGVPVARGIMVPFRGRSPFPSRGWDEVVVWAAEDALDGVAPDTACGLEIAVDPSCQGRGLSSVVLTAMREVVVEAGLSSLVIPVRPPDKARVPGVSMADYASATRPDGLPVDRWLRTHVRAGGVIAGVASCSATVQGSLASWRRWTGMPFDRDGLVVVPGALAPVFVSTVDDFAVYVEANVWVSHAVAGF